MPQAIEKQSEVYTLQEDGTFVKEITIITEEIPTQEEVIAEKEAELLKMYQELEALKQQQG